MHLFLIIFYILCLNESYVNLINFNKLTPRVYVKQFFNNNILKLYDGLYLICFYDVYKNEVFCSFLT